jgi:hypothetical protein
MCFGSRRARERANIVDFVTAHRLRRDMRVLVSAKACEKTALSASISPGTGIDHSPPKWADPVQPRVGLRSKHMGVELNLLHSRRIGIFLTL